MYSPEATYEVYILLMVFLVRSFIFWRRVQPRIWKKKSTLDYSLFSFTLSFHYFTVRQIINEAIQYNVTMEFENSISGTGEHFNRISYRINTLGVSRIMFLLCFRILTFLFFSTQATEKEIETQWLRVDKWRERDIIRELININSCGWEWVT